MDCRSNWRTWPDCFGCSVWLRCRIGFVCWLILTVIVAILAGGLIGVYAI